MYNTTNFFCDKGVPPIEDWSEYDTTFSHFTAVVVTLLGNCHPVSGLLIVLVRSLCGRLGQWAHQYQQTLLEFIYRINANMMIFFYSSLNPQGSHLVLTNLKSFQ